MRLNDNRMSSADWVNLALFLDLNDGQKFLLLVLPHIAEPNGCFEHDPKLICGLTRCSMPDLEILFRSLNSEGLLIPYKVEGKQYWYLTRFLEMQRLRQKSKVPSPPWLYWEPEAGSADMSKGKYRVNIEKFHQYTGLQTVDKNPPPELSRGEESREEISRDKDKKECASAENIERMKLALNRLLDGENGIRTTLKGCEEQQMQTIQRMLQLTSKKLGVNDIANCYEVYCDEGNWSIKNRGEGR